MEIIIIAVAIIVAYIAGWMFGCKYKDDLSRITKQFDLYKREGERRDREIKTLEQVVSHLLEEQPSNKK